MGRVSQKFLEVHYAQIASRWGFVGWEGYEHLSSQNWLDFFSSNQGHCLSNCGVGGTDYCLRSHHSTRGIRLIGQQLPNVVGLFIVHEAKKHFRALGGQVGHQVGRIIRAHQVKNFGGSLIIKIVDDLQLLFFGELF